MDRSPHPTTTDLFAVPWAIVSAALESDVDVIDLRHATRARAPEAHCAACQGKRIESLVAPSGAHYHRCLDCHRLWEIRDDRRYRLVTDATVLDPVSRRPGRDASTG